MLRNLLFTLSFLLFGIAQPVIASTFYVSTNGNDQNSGGAASPFRTIQFAADRAQPGDKVIVSGGTFYERVKVNTSGTLTQPIIFEGERGPNGERKTIIDGSDPVTGWVSDPGVGPGVWKARTVPYKVYWMGVEEQGSLKDIYRSKDLKLLTYLSSKTDSWLFAKIRVNFWDGFEALWFGTGTYTKNYADGANPGSVKVRFRNGDDPNNKAIRISNGSPVINLTNQSYITIKGFIIRGARRGIDIFGASSVGVVIDDNDIMNGSKKIQIKEASDIAIRNNKIHRNGLGADSYSQGPFSWNSPKVDSTPAPGTPLYQAGIREKYFKAHKGYTGFESGYGIDLIFANGAHDIEISGNEIFDISADAIRLRDVHNVDIFNNDLHNCTNNMIGISWNTTGLKIHDNLFREGATNIRFWDVDWPKHSKQAYIYRNRFYLPPGFGTHLYFHWVNDGAPAGNHEFYFYHNSFSGGYTGIGFSPYAKNSGVPNAHFINNILSLGSNVNGTGTFWTTWSADLGTFAYNQVGYKSPQTIPWKGSGNVLTTGTPIWVEDGHVPDFSLPTNSQLREAGIDLSKPFVINGKSLNPLPGMHPGYFFGSKPDLGAIQHSKTGDHTRPKPPTGVRIVLE